ncbi:hypothetical protein JCM10207_006652 [Rhodosporidiobolus poonsookiae]
MASPYTSTPRSQHSSYHRTSHAAVTDTPTPSSHNSLPPSSSIRPMASNSNLKDLGAAALKRRATLTHNQGLRAGSPNTLNRPASRLSKSSLFDSELEGLADPIQRDNTELDRINKENSIQRIIGDLQNDRISLSSGSSTASRSSAGQLEHERRREFADEDVDDRDSASSASSRVSSLSSFRIGMASRQRAGVDPLDPLDPPSEDDITYVTLPRTNDSPAASPYKAQLGKSPTAPPARGLFGSPRPVAASSPLRPNRYADENLPPAPVSAQPTFKRSPFAASPNAYPTVPPPRAFPPPLFARSPLTTAAGYSAGQSRPSPLNPQINSPILGGSPTATYTGTGSRTASRHHASRSLSSVSAAAAAEAQLDADAADRTTTTAAGGYRLPNATVLTEALGSPLKARTTAAAAALGRARNSPARTASTANGSGSGGSGKTGRSAEANLVSQHLSSLTSKLATLERDNAASSLRVAELEAQLAAASSSAARHTAAESADVARLRTEVERLLVDERERYAQLEGVVGSLRAQNTHLDAVLEQQHADLEALRRERAAAAAAPPPQTRERDKAFRAGDDLRDEVADLKNGLAVLGYEVDGVRTVVEELLRDKEERAAGRSWEAEEAERRRELAQQQQQREEEEDQDRTPRPRRTAPRQQGREEESFDVPGTPVSGRSFVSAAEIERLQAEQELEQLRRTPKTHKTRLQRGVSPPPRPASAPLPRSSHPHPHAHAHAHARSTTSLDDETYRPSTATYDGDSQTFEDDADAEDAYYTETDAPETLPPLPTHKHSHSRKPAADEPDFSRAEQIFADVSRATERSPRRKTQRRSTQARAKGDRDRVVLVEEASANLCANCHGRKKGLERSEEKEKEKVRRRREEKVKEQEEARREEKRAARRKEREREEHRRTLEGVLERLEEEFAVQKKIYLELTAEYQSMTSRHDSGKRRALASHLKQSIDVLEDKARDVKQYADALDDIYAGMHHPSCPTTGRKRHAVV